MVAGQKPPHKKLPKIKLPSFLYYKSSPNSDEASAGRFLNAERSGELFIGRFFVGGLMT